MLQEMKTAKGIPDSFHVRVGVKDNAGCQGVNYMMGFDHPLPTDEVYEIGGHRFAVDKGHVMHIVGMTIDYTEEENSRGFTFTA